jgi:hypothetical protein
MALKAGSMGRSRMKLKLRRERARVEHARLYVAQAHVTLSCHEDDNSLAFLTIRER